jgi:hypothetical protein
MNSTTTYNSVISDNGLKGLKHVGIVIKGSAINNHTFVLE